MKKIFISFFVFIFSVSVYGIQYDFEDGVIPTTINDIQKGTLSVSSDHAKNGNKISSLGLDGYRSAFPSK